MKAPSSITDYVYLCLLNEQWWTYWDLQKAIQKNFGKFYDTTTISAALRELRKPHSRDKYNLPTSGEVVPKRKRQIGRGYEFKLERTL